MASLLVGISATQGAAAGVDPWAGLPEPHCYDAAQANADYEAYGPTDVSVQAGDGRVTVGENTQGTLTVFKYPNPSFYNQVKYVAVSRDASGRVQAQLPNEGSFAGIRYRTAEGVGFSWLRDWRSTQAYDSSDTPAPVAVYSSPSALGLTVTDVDLVVPGSAAFVRQYWVSRARSSPVRDAQLVYFENFNPIGTRLQYAPIADWCLSQLSDQHAAYDPQAHAIVNWWQGVDSASGRPSSVALAVGFDVSDSARQVGGDGHDPAALPGQAADGYDQLAAGDHQLGGATEATGQTTGAIEQPLRFDAQGRAAARVEIAGGTDSTSALSALSAARGQRFVDQMASVAADWHGFLARTRLPASADQRVISVAKRSLITTRLAIDPDSGAIVASADTQGPYGEDWIRDGSFINQVLDANGYSDVVTRHNLFYAAAQTSPQNPSPVRAFGNWGMNSYGDGIDGGPIPYEIDETGLGAWTLYAHAASLTGAPRQAYLQAVYPAIARAADYMTACVDPTSGLQCVANEDDNPTPSQSLHGAETVYLGLQSAVAAAADLHQASAEVASWRARLASLGKAIAALYDPAAGAYREGNTQGNAYNLDYGDGGWLLWPVAFRPYADPTMQHEADAVRAAMDKSLAGREGEYESKALLGLAHAWGQPTPDQRHELQAVLGYMASALTTPTGLFGEAWERFSGRPVPVEDMPHVWEHALFYLAALTIDGARPYTFQAADFYAGACESETAPPSACPAAPVIEGFSVTRARFRARPRASAFLFSVSEAATVRIALTRLRKRGGGAPVGALGAAESAGRHVLGLGGRIAGRKLRAGAYRAIITARSPGAPPATPRVARFVIVGR